MATEVDHLFRALAEDADRAHVAGPADLRRRSDRRTAVQAAVGTVAVVAVVAAVLIGGGALRGDSTRDLTPVEPASPTPTATASTTPTAPMTVIPASAWLDAADLNDSADPLDTGDGLLRPCTEALLGPADSQVTVSGAVVGSYRAPDLPLDYVPDGTVHQIIQVYRPETLTLVLTRMLSIATSCPTGVTIQPDLGTPDLAMLLRLTTMQGDTPVRSWVAVVRVEDTLSLLWLQGWEGTSAREGDARRLAAAAAVRLHAWLG
jgi:hypothetical protein